MAVSDGRTGFSEVFNRTAAACAELQRLVRRSARTITQSRVSRAHALPLRRTAAQTRMAWAKAEVVHAVLRDEVECVARALRDAGMDSRSAVATVRSRIRFVLYDGG